MSYNEVVQAIADATQDAQTLEDVVNGAPDTQYKSRLGRKIWTLATINNRVDVATNQANQKLTELQDAINTAAAAGAGANGWTAELIVDKSGATQQQVNYNGGSKWHPRVGGYKLNERAVLANGDIVKSTINGNINDPNVNMTGWVKPNSASQILYANGYTAQAALYYLTPEMFGAKGNYLLPDGTVNPSPHDDYQAIQSMLDAGAIGCTFEFDGSKTYYNAFGDFTPLSPWLDEDDRPQWTRRKRCTFKFNGARLTRRRPDWNTNNAVNDGNTGAYYTDDRTALLKLVGTGDVDDIWYIHDADFDSNVPLGWLYNHGTGAYDIGDGSYGAGTCMDWGLRLENIGVIKGTNCSFQRSCFPVSAKDVGYISMDGLILKYAAQARYRTNNNDPGAYGGGIKLENCKNFYLNDVYGYKNANDTIELERYNGHGIVNGWSEFDINQSFMIYSSHDITVNWTGKDIIRGSGFTIKASGAGSNSSNVRGKINLERVYGTGLDIIIDADYDRDLTGIDIDLQTTDCGYGGLQIVNNSPTHMPKGIKINHIDYNGRSWLNASRKFVGKMSGTITGASYAINGYSYPAGFRGFVIEGTNAKDSCLTMTLDLTAVPIAWQVAETAFVSLRNTITSWGVFNLTADRQNISGGCSPGLHYPYNVSFISSSELALDGGKFKAVNLSSTASENGQIYVDLSSGVNVGSGTAYNVKLFKKP